MKITVDWDRCEGHGLCEASAPSVFSLDDEGTLTYYFEGRDVPAELEEPARAAAGVCPVLALRVEQ